jgi:Kef-type K+ transport system membrane component KefB/nucleotide-binding universal stress UspA family protein
MSPALISGHFMTIAALGGDSDHRVIVFFLEVMLLMIVGRLLGEAMQRLRQPAVIGQLLAGIILGPSVFGGIWPSLQQAIFPVHAADRQMLNAVSELGVLLLLLLTGMETNLALVKRARRTALSISLAGIVFPFVLGYALGQFLPAGILPDPNRRLFTSLFLAVALSISSVKIVATVLREVDFLRRDLGQVILAAAISDDIIGWTLLALIGGLAAHGEIVVGPALLAIGGTIAFLIACFTIGHRWTARVIRWVNDHFIIEMPVISLILVIMLGLALLTDAIGVHTVLGAFVAGIMIGESPILTKHIEEQLRGLIGALFMPVFFGVAGLSIDLKVLGDPRVLGIALLFIGIASLGKLGGCYLGGHLARLRHSEALAIGFAMNARGSTEIILATIGLTMGVLNQLLFTIIVVMAVVTTLCMPPLLQWALARVPMREEEKTRLETEAAEEKDLLPKVERVLVVLDDSDNAWLASRLSGWFVGARHLVATVLDLGATESNGGSSVKPAQAFLAAAEAAAKAVESQEEKETAAVPESESAVAAKPVDKRPIGELVSIQGAKEKPEATVDVAVETILTELKNGYGLLILGLDEGTKKNAPAYPAAMEKIVREFDGPVALVIHGSQPGNRRDERLERILVPTTGSDYSRFGAELAVGIAKGCGAKVTALHISAPPVETDLLRRPAKLLRPARALLGDIVALGDREGVQVKAQHLVGLAKESSILQQAYRGRHQLIVLGTKAWSADELHFGRSAEAIINNAPGPVLIVKS